MHISAPSSPDRSLGALPEALQRRPRLALVLLCLLLWLPGFFTLPATDRDESRFAQATKQMLDSGDYVRIRVGEEERNKKPAGIHWAQAASVHVLEAARLGGRDDIWAYRVPSLLGGILAVLATFHWGRSLVGRRAAFLGAAMLASCMVLMAEAHIAKTDAALLATVAAAMGLFAQAYLRPGQFTARQAAGFWLVLGASMLLKGPVGPMVPLLAGITLAIADKGAPWLRALRPGWGLPLMVAAAAPWFVAIGIATEGRFFEQAVGGDMLSKIGSGEEKHGAPPGFYLLTFGIAAFPGAWIVLCALPTAWRERLNPPTRFLLAWVVPSWLVFEAVQTKLPHYTLPLYPALMLLGAAWAMDPLRRLPPRWWRRVAFAALALVALGIALASEAAFGMLMRRWLEAGLLVLPLAALLVWLVWRSARQGGWGRAGLLGALLAVPLYAAVMEGVAPRLAPLWVAPRLAATLEAQAPGLPARDFGITGHSEPSVLFALGGEVSLLRTGRDAARFLGGGPARVVAVGDRAERDFREEAAALALPYQEIGQVTGFNYTRGRWVTLLLFRRAA
ncbi:ArnT family glycosyltransferase [Paracraurococcus ruber]|uniref:Dolichyl-phosphate-mannose-protein mannosyltransferase n=1 Tax=Paracraurococcus ruber TaxID=77675 RepID=A0ABS1CYT8_9PROT|nr:glycosyltransferase family 39 protein [Paracraurococcus ruber]MBK1659578.1 dolichyl-phosphate-mannose-protein mannosyltransferase [Paracraurococcus ruber]TDG28774.1 phospholipid carrier-dependent glycosyltransferase [Paracraurococcus ruber]